MNVEVVKTNTFFLTCLCWMIYWHTVFFYNSSNTLSSLNFFSPPDLAF